jgi:hypothetical protein
VVSNRVKVPNLNADRVDGLSAESFARVAGGVGTRSASSTARSLDPASNGNTDTLVAVASCPFGTVLTGGGYADYTRTGVVVESSPTPDNTMWVVTVVVDPTVTEHAQDVLVTATCYNPKGPVRPPTQAMSTPATQVQEALTAGMLAKVAAKRAHFR